MDAAQPDGGPFRVLASRTLRDNAPLVLTDDVRALLLRTAREVAIPDADGEFDGARQEMRDVLAVEVVPYYLLLAQEQLDDMADEP
ncbi:DUSAM domain-containing protein [Stigmatella aurantiaca]|uniref:DUSAM domain-containing protein n=1 Tax=Stigmatella aurantiaca TaxID=41 RepID=A0A1H8EKY8_STIAU|nr:DUF2379 family protein [Stigmatella aurantiaca]SEN20149.1 DUSAM domain-containing protein [Stigmatella aurantiaca]